MSDQPHFHSGLLKLADHPQSDDSWHALVRQQVRSLRFGVVQIVVHDGRVTQIERTERVRLASPPSAE
jgi:hypothetical protein